MGDSKIVNTASQGNNMNNMKMNINNIGTNVITTVKGLNPGVTVDRVV